MNKRMRELFEAMEAKRKALSVFMEGEEKDMEKAAAVLDEIEAMQKEYELCERAMKLEKDAVPADDVVEKKGEVDSTKAFADAARRGFKSMNEGTPADGGYTVPEDINTAIEKLRDAKASLLHLVKVVPVSTNKGERTFKKRAQQTGFVKVGEGGKIGQKNTPQFGRYGYEIKKYAGWLPVTNELLEDSDANIVSEVTEWLADESRVTANKLILEALDAKYTRSESPETAVTLNHVDDVKRVLNVTLGQAFKPYSKIVTNDDGLQILDIQKDGQGNYLLKTNPQDPMRMQLSAGSHVIQVEVIPNADMPSDEAKGAPFYIGDFAEAVTFWDRKKRTIKASDIAVAGELNAYEEDLTLFRAIEREDVTVKDEAAYVKCFWKETVEAAG